MPVIWFQIVVMFFLMVLGTTGKNTYVFFVGFGYDFLMVLDMFSFLTFFF